MKCSLFEIKCSLSLQLSRVCWIRQMWSVRVVNQWYYHSCATITCRTATSQKALWNHRNEFVNKIVIYSCKSNGSIWKKNCIGMKIMVSMKYSQVSSSAQTTASSLTRLKSCWFYERRLYCTVTYVIYHIYIYHIAQQIVAKVTNTHLVKKQSAILYRARVTACHLLDVPRCLKKRAFTSTWKVSNTRRSECEPVSPSLFKFLRFLIHYV